MPTDKTTDLTVEGCLADLREMFPTWKYFALTVSIGARSGPVTLKIGPSFYSPQVKRFDRETLTSLIDSVRKWKESQQ